MHFSLDTPRRDGNQDGRRMRRKEDRAGAVVGMRRLPYFSFTKVSWYVSMLIFYRRVLLAHVSVFMEFSLCVFSVLPCQTAYLLLQA